MTSKEGTKNKKDTPDESKKVDFPDFPDLKSDQISAMSHEEKLKLIEKEAKTLYDFCIEKGLSKKDLTWCLRPLFGSPPELVKKAVKDNSKLFMTLALIGCILAIIFGWSTAYNLVCVHGKLALMKVLPYWDWTYLYEQDCIVKNPYITPERNLTKEDCQACFDLTKNGIEGLRNVSQEVIANDFLLVDFPAIIEDGTKDWPNPNFNLDSLSKDYRKHKDLDSVGDCRFKSSIENMSNVYDFFEAYESGSLPKTYFAHWENCDLKAAKHFRLNYRRPYYLPQMAEAAKMNSFLVAKGQSEEPVALSGDDSSGMWLTVISGKLMVDLVPAEGCGKFKRCATISNELKKGEALITPLRLWQVDASSVSGEETIAIGSTMTWDEGEGLPPEEEEEGRGKGAPLDGPPDGPDSEPDGPDSQPDGPDSEPDGPDSEPIDRPVDDAEGEPDERDVDDGKGEPADDEEDEPIEKPVEGAKDVPNDPSPRDAKGEEDGGSD